MTPQLSVIIPTYKRTDSLERVLDCLLAQQNITLEIIVVDQNEPGYIKQELILKLPNVIYIYQDKANAALARNNGFKKSSAQYVLFLDDDLIPAENFCSEGLKKFSEFSKIKCFVPLVYSYQRKELALYYLQKKRISSYPKSTSVFSVTDAVSAAVFFERNYYKLSGGFDNYLFDFAKTSEDLELFLRMQKRNMILWFVSTLEIFHDEKTEGGCELRTVDYWISRQKHIRALALIYRIHNSITGRLSLKNLIQLMRFSFANKKALRSGVENILKEIQLMKLSLNESKLFFIKHRSVYFNSSVNFIN